MIGTYWYQYTCLLASQVKTGINKSILRSEYY